jgi:ATP-binding cassette, subfamily B, bacterial PglK
VRVFDFWPISSLKKKSVALPIKLLSSRDRFLLIAVVAITLFLAFLDLLGVLLIGVIGSLSITGVSTGQVGNRVAVVLRLLGIDNQGFERQVVIVGILAAILLIAKTVFSLYLVKKVMFFMARRAASLSADLIMRYFSISVSKINQRSAQSSIYALTEGVTTIMVGVIGVSVAVFSDIALLLVMGIGLFLVDPITAISTAIIFGFLAFFLYANMHETMRKLGEQQGRMNIESSQRIFEAISSYRELLVRDRRGYYADQIAKLRYKLADGNAKINYLSSLSKYVLEITLVFSALLLAFYQFSVNSAFRALATITIFIAASTRITPAILRLQQGFLRMKSAIAEARPTILLIEDLSSVTAEKLKIKLLSRSHQGFIPSVSVSNLSFSYIPSHAVLDRVNFRAGPGEFIAIVGGSGAGKTTLVDLILGALEAQDGEISISGNPPKLSFARWPGAVAYVPQDSPVINGTIRENLALGFPASELSDEICWEALQVAHLGDFVKTLSHQLDTFVGDRGTSLSGGQRQRLGIARALITRPKLLFLDEATSSLDGVTEYEISESLKKFRGEMTLIVIAHRLSTVVNADRIYFLERGKVKSFGTFEELKTNTPEFLEQAKLMGL